MKRRNFIRNSLVAGTSGLVLGHDAGQLGKFADPEFEKEHLTADFVVIGAGLGGCAAAIAALRNGLRVILTEETDWIGGQMTQQGVPPDEHQWIETHGATQLYRDFRSEVRNYYMDNYPLTESAKKRKDLNPGDGAVSRLCHEPKVALAVLNQMLNPYISSGKLILLLDHKVAEAKVDQNRVISVSLKSERTNRIVTLSAAYFADATELGDLLPLTGTEFVAGAESKSETGELHAPEKGDPENTQAFTMCFAMDYREGENHVIEKPKEYDFWRDFAPKLKMPWSGRLLDLSYSNPKTLEPKRLGFHPKGVATGDSLNLWVYRRIISKANFVDGFYASDVTIVNWPQNDYFLGNLIGADKMTFKKHVDRAKQLSLSLLYWLQTEVPRPDGGKGWSGLRLRKDVMGTEDGLAKYPYVRESRRIRALFTVKEEHVGAANRAMITGRDIGNSAADFYDSVGVGYYHIDLHPSTGGNNYIDFASFPFQIPLGALIPQRVENLLPANKNIGTTHLTNGCYRLHPVEWSIGESIGLLVKFALERKSAPKEIREKPELLGDFQKFIRSQGIETEWPKQ